MAIDAGFEIETANATTHPASHKSYIFISLLVHVMVLSAFAMMAAMFGGKTAQKSSDEAVFVNLNAPLSSPQKSPLMASGGNSGPKITQKRREHQNRKHALFSKPAPKHPAETAKKKPATLSEPMKVVKKTETKPVLHADSDSVSSKDLPETAPPAPSFQKMTHALVGGGTGPPSQGLGKPGASGSGTGSLSGSGALGMGEVDQLPKIIEKEEPFYPHNARRRHIEGKITVKFLVSASGEVMKPSVVSAEPGGIFEENVLNAVKRWKFKPGTYQGKAVATWMMLPVRFELD